MLKYALLGFLNYHTLTGYELKQIMESSTSNFWHADLSQIYKALKSLQAEGHVVSTVEQQVDRPDRRNYEITEKGQQALREWLALPLTTTSRIKEELLLKIFFSGHSSPESILTQLRLQRDLHQQSLTHYGTQTVVDVEENAAALAAPALDKLLWESTRRAGVLYEEMYITWLNETIASIEAFLAGEG
ncbi:PadR family transcriptional regulator [Candidatus Saccharibacteria bacterium]|nr:PadR family transcriptional regulator [Candidatus Saccharibacteria bacterium]